MIHLDQDILGSPIWHAASANKHLIKDHSLWEIDNRANADFFRDYWQQLPKIKEEVELPILHANLTREGVLKVKDLWAPNEEVSPFRQWRLKKWFWRQSPREEMRDLLQLLAERKIEIRDCPDRI